MRSVPCPRAARSMFPPPSARAARRAARPKVAEARVAASGSVRVRTKRRLHHPCPCGSRGYMPRTPRGQRPRGERRSFRRLHGEPRAIEPVFAPVMRPEGSPREGKSLADTVMVADGVDLLWTVAPDVFVLATSDKDMIPLARIAKQRGAAIQVGFKMGQGDQVIAALGEFRAAQAIKLPVKL